MSLWSAFLDLLFPPRCAFCGKVLPGRERGMCSACRRDLPWLEGEEAEQTGEFFSLCVSPLRYQDKVADSIRRYKFKGLSSYAGLYGTLVAQCVKDHLAGRYDLITWAPLSPQRRRERGYDQAFLLAQAAAPYLSDYVVGEMTCVGSILIIALGLNMLGITKLKIMNYLPAMFLPIVLCLFMEA